MNLKSGAFSCVSAKDHQTGDVQSFTVPAQRATGRIVGDATPGPMADVKYSNSSTI